MRKVLSLVALSLAVSACSSSHTAAPTPSEPTYSDANAVATAAHLDNCSPSNTGHDFVTEVSCGQRAVVLNFDTADHRDQWLEGYMANGISGDAAVLTGDRWAVACPQRITCEGLSSALGGTLKP